MVKEDIRKIWITGIRPDPYTIFYVTFESEEVKRIDVNNVDPFIDPRASIITPDLLKNFVINHLNNL